jgi:hypothetical protein
MKLLFYARFWFLLSAKGGKSWKSGKLHHEPQRKIKVSVKMCVMGKTGK